MSIEQTGPQGYEYQYLLTIYLALLMWKHERLELIVEQKDGEDAELHFIESKKTITIEAQVKSEQGNLGISNLTKWISHFPNQKDTGNLLHRIQNDSQRFALFITKSRCSDDTQTFQIPMGNIYNHVRTPLQGKRTDLFLETYSKLNEERKSTPLKQLRDTYCKVQAQQLKENKSILYALSRRILIWEQTDSLKIKDEVVRLLKLDHHIPMHKAHTSIIELDMAVREARDERKDVIPLMRSILNRNAGDRAFSRPVDVLREGTNLLHNDLELNHVLLLTGISFCGKSHLAESIAEELRAKQGFTFQKDNQLDSAYRFLTIGSSESRICFLEDPFGHTKLNSDALNTWTRLYALIGELAPHRKLIVTSRKDLLQQLSGSHLTKSWDLGNAKWRDLTVNDSFFAIQVWSEYSKLKQLPPSVYERVEVGMAVQPSGILQPGQIRHLALSDRNLLIDKNFAELSSIARVDSVQLGQSFQNRLPSELILLNVMVLGTTIGFGIVERDLDLLLHLIHTELKVSEGLQLAHAFCEELEQAGYIVFSKDRWMFSHPTYYEAAMYVAEQQGRFGQQRLLIILQQMLNNGNADIMLACMRNFGRIYESYHNDNFRDEIRRMAIHQLKSPFPNMRDEALILLTERVEELPAGEVNEVMKYIEGYRFMNNRLEWNGGIPKLKESSGFTNWPSMRDTEDITEKEFHAIAKRLCSLEEASKISAEEAWGVVRVMNQYTLEARRKFPLLKQLLNYKEAFIREAAAYKLLHEYGDNLEYIDRVFSDPHPFVVLQGIQGSFQGWCNWTSEVRERILTNLQKVFMSKVNCVAAHDFMTNCIFKPEKFYLNYENLPLKKREEVIRLWGTLLPLFLEHVPDEFLEINEAYLFESASKAASSFTEDQVVRITEAWTKWMERSITHWRPSDYGMGFLDFLLKNTKKSTNYRGKLVVRLLSHPDSYVVSMSIAEYVNYWPKLHTEEQSHVITLLQSDRSDVRWFKAIALTREKVPSVLSNLLLGDLAALSLPLDLMGMIRLIDPSLLSDAIEVFNPEHRETCNLVGSSYGYQWPSIILELLNRPEHPAFPSALSYALRWVISTSASKEFKDTVIQACSVYLNNNREIAITLMTDHLLHWTVRINGADSRSLWELLYEHLNEAELIEVADRLAEVIECISLNGDTPAELLGDRIYSYLLEHYLSSDQNIWKLEVSHTFAREGIFAYLDSLLEKEPPRVYLSYEILQSRIHHSSDEKVTSLLHKIEVLRKQLISIAFVKKENVEHVAPLEGWIELKRNN
ncbi:hypothetical protein [Paenibacillus piscarius]|uniref:nSTAND3 domain-containing NTPase n=1 Tax=Paenibacillus piscarius TaxID=1089681 RepID=UPI001EE89644|nr:hypothetical protein [Paenibacillus piscarius]